MKVCPQFALLLAAGFIQMAAGLTCESNCAACYKDNSPGVDIKFCCGPGNHCGRSCPPGYSDLHCAKGVRCA